MREASQKPSSILRSNKAFGLAKVFRHHSAKLLSRVVAEYCARKRIAGRWGPKTSVHRRQESNRPRRGTLPGDAVLLFTETTMTIAIAKKCSKDNLDLFASPSGEPEKVNLYTGLYNLAKGIEKLDRDVRSLTQDTARVRCDIDHLRR